MIYVGFSQIDNLLGKYFMYAYYKVPKMARGRDTICIFICCIEGGTLYVYLYVALHCIAMHCTALVLH